MLDPLDFYASLPTIPKRIADMVVAEVGDPLSIYRKAMQLLHMPELFVFTDDEEAA